VYVMQLIVVLFFSEIILCKRDKIVHEMVATEKSYLTKLDVVIQVSTRTTEATQTRQTTGTIQPTQTPQQQHLSLGSPGPLTETVKLFLVPIKREKLMSLSQMKVLCLDVCV